MGNKMEIDQDIDWLYAQVVKGGLKRPTEKQEDALSITIKIKKPSMNALC